MITSAVHNIIHQSLFFQGSYGIVKLAYNKEDESHYVSRSFLLFLLVSMAPTP